MKIIKYMVLVGLTLTLAISLVAGACAPAAPTGDEGAAEIAALEDDLAAEEAKVKSLEGDIDDLEDDIAALKKPAKVYKWRLQIFNTAAATQYRTVGAFTDMLDQLTDGQIEIDVYAGGEILPSTEILGAIGEGTLDLATTQQAYHTGLIGPVANFTAGAPFLYESFSEWLLLYKKLGMEDLIRETYAPHGAHLISVLRSNSVNLHSSVPIRSRDDFIGMKFRSFGMQSSLLEALGASTVYVPGEEIYTGLATGVFDACTWGSPSNNRDSGLHEVAGYWTAQSHVQMSNDVIINADLWSELPDNLKAALASAVPYWSTEVEMLLFHEDADALVEMQEEGLQVIRIPDEEWAKIRAVAPGVWETDAEGDPTALRALDIVAEFQRVLGR